MVIHHLGSIVGIGVGRSTVLLALGRLTHVGWLGVDVFFVLSGFLITGIIVGERDRPDFWSDFYLRRAFRILPAFLVVFLVTLVAAQFLAPEIHVPKSYLVPALFFLANWTIVSLNEMPMLTHLWSLAVEEQFYFLWPQAAKRMKKDALLKLALILAVASEGIRIALAILHVNPYMIYKVTPSRIDGLAIGAALAIAITLPAPRRLLVQWWRRIAILAAVMLPVAFLVMHGSLFVFNVGSQVLAIPPTIVLTAMLIFGAVQSTLPAVIGSVLSNPVMTYLGRRSYGLYLIHEPIHVAMQRSRTDGYLSHWRGGALTNCLLILGAVVVSLILTEISWRLVEQPAQRLRRRLMRSGADGTPRLSEEKIIRDIAR